MRKYFLLTLMLFTASGAFAAESTTFCQGSSLTDDDLVYDRITFSTSFTEGRGTYSVEADGHNDKFEYDINNRFSNLPFIGETKKSASGRITSAKINGKVLPDGRSLKATIDMSRAETEGKLAIERTDGVYIKAVLKCETKLAPVCHEETHCGKRCNPHIGCEPYCGSKTVCEPGKFD